MHQSTPVAPSGLDSSNSQLGILSVTLQQRNYLLYSIVTLQKKLEQNNSESGGIYIVHQEEHLTTNLELLLIGESFIKITPKNFAISWILQSQFCFWDHTCF